MGIRTIFVPLFANLDSAAPLDAALHLARSAGAHIDAVLIRADPATTLAEMGTLGFVAADTMDQLLEEGGRMSRDSRTQFTSWTAARRVPTEPQQGTPFARWFDYVGWLEEAIVQHGRVADLLVMNWPTRTSPSAAAFEAAVFSTGRPAILVPPGSRPDLLRSVLIAWNGSLESTRSVAGALPLLQAAGEVSIMTIPEKRRTEESIDLAAALHWHGINCQQIAPHDDHGSPGQALLRAAQERDASLIVMGAYTHGRVRQMLLGGVTEYVLDNPAVPILMAH